MSRAYFLSAILFIAGAGIGFLTGINSNPKISNSGSIEESLYNPLFSSQTAAIRARITNINGKNLIVENLNNQTTGRLTISDQVIIIKPNQTSPSSDLDSLETNKEVLIGLEMTNGQYEVVSIQYILPPPSLPPLSIE